MTQPLLELHEIVKQFGGLRAIDNVSFDVQPGEIKAVIGPNGAGKTTLFNCLTGITQPTNGSIRLQGRELAGRPPHWIAGQGLARTWQTIHLFDDMTVLENVLVGCHPVMRCGMLHAALRTPWQRREERSMRARAMDLLARFNLAEAATLFPGELPFLQQRRVELARALAANPVLLCLDEPAAGLNSRETIELGELIQQLRNDGMTVLLVEHDMDLVMSISDHVLVLDHGVPLAEGKPQEIQENEDVIAVYLGSEVDLC